ncbi:MAG: hypothetical protein ACXV3E_04480, partial [Halobacteriota archaeon]
QNKQQPDIKIMFVGLTIILAWLLFWALWLFFYTSGFSIMQNLGVFLLSLVVLLVLETLLTVPFARRQPPQQQKERSDYDSRHNCLNEYQSQRIGDLFLRRALHAISLYLLGSGRERNPIGA